MSKAGQRILDGIKDAIEGNFAAVTIDGQRWVPAKTVARPREEWTEEDGDVLWWAFPVREPPYVGSPLDLGQSIAVVVLTHQGEQRMPNAHVGGWPGYHTHWTPIEIPEPPVKP